MSRAPVGKLRLWTGQPVNAPFVTPPIGLRAILVICVLSVTGTLLLGVSRQLAAGGAPDDSASALVLIAFFWFLLPILLATTIVTNRAPSRLLSLAYFGFVAVEVARYIDTLTYAPATRSYLAAVAGLLWLAMLYWMYRSARMRIYYALISGRPVPDDLAGRVDELTSPGRTESMFGRISGWVAGYTEILAAIVILAFVIVAWVSMRAY
jgi:hypothetical protein